MIIFTSTNMWLSVYLCVCVFGTKALCQFYSFCVSTVHYYFYYYLLLFLKMKLIILRIQNVQTWYLYRDKYIYMYIYMPQSVLTADIQKYIDGWESKIKRGREREIGKKVMSNKKKQLLFVASLSLSLSLSCRLQCHVSCNWLRLI